MPPDLYAQLKKAIAVVVGGYGLSAHLEEDRGAEMDAYQRYWAWQRQLRADEDKWPSVETRPTNE